MDLNENIIDKLYLNPVIEGNTHRKMLNPIHIKPQEINRKRLGASRSVPDLFAGSGGNIIMQNWNTKNNVPKDVGNYLNLPIIVDRKKIKKFLENKKILKLPENQEKLKLKHSNNDEVTNPNQLDKNIMGMTSTNSKFTISNYSGQSFGVTNTNSKFSNISHTVSGNKETALVVREEESKENTEIAKREKSNQNNEQALVHSYSTARINNSLSLRPPPASRALIDFSVFDKHLYLHDNDFLYAKRVGGPVDFVLCAYQEINRGGVYGGKVKSPFVKKIKNVGKNSKIPEYLTISKNTILHYQNGVPHIYSITEWVDNYIKYKKLMSIPLFKNFKTAKLYELWRRFFKKTKRAYYTEKLKKKFHLIDLSLLKGILEIRKILKEMGYFNIFKLDIPSPVFLNKFSQIYIENLQENNRKIDEFRARVKRELAYACNTSYKEFKKAKNITLDDNTSGAQGSQKDEDGKEKAKKNVNNSNSIQAFLKDAIPYAQDATRKTHYKKILRFIRLIDFLFNEAKFNLIQFSLEMLNKKFQRLYDVYINQWADSPILITMILTMQNKISYNPSIKLISTAVFDHFIQENIYAVIYKRSFIDPQEFPTYMTCFEEVFELSVDQNSNLNERIKDNQKFITTYKTIKQNFDNCFKELEKYSLGLTPILENYIKYTSINFKELENTATPDSLRDLIEKFTAEDVVVKKLKRKVNIGIFEFQLDYLLDKVVSVPQELLSKLFTVIPVILVKKLNNLTNEITNYHKKIQINPNDVESFIRLKKAIEECGKVKGKLEEESDEIRELINIVNNHKDIKMQDYDLKLISELSGVRSNFERRFDSMTYYIDSNIKRYRGELQKTIKEFDNKIRSLIDEINDEEINSYHDDTAGPILLLEDKSRQIEKAVESKKVYQQEEIDIEMDERELSNFENLDTLTYEYELKIKLWNNVKEFQDKTKYWDTKQVMMIDLADMNLFVKKWNELCTVAIIDLELSNVPSELKRRVEVYEKIIPVVTTIQNDNIQNIDYLRDNLKTLLNINFDFNDLLFTLQKLMDLPNLQTIYDELLTLNTQANEERRIKDIYKTIHSTFTSHKIPLRMRTDAEKGTKYVIFTDDMDEEYEYIEKNLKILNKESLNKYVYVIKDDFNKLIASFYKYQTFLDLYNAYQIFMLKCDGLINNSEFAKEMPLEYKKLSNDSLTKSLIKTLKDNLNLGKYIDYAHERAINSLNTLISGYETNYKAVNIYLDKKRKEYQPYYLLSNDDLMELIVEKESKDIRTRLLKKIFPWIRDVDPGMETDEMIKCTTFDMETLSFKYVKATRTLRDALETIEFGLSRKLKELIKMFKREYELALRPKSLKQPKEVVIDLVKNKDALGQAVFNCSYAYVMDSIEKGLAIEEEAFDKLFDLYHECKDERRVQYMQLLKQSNTSELMRKMLISLISLENFVIVVIENLIREDVYNVNDFAYLKIFNVKIENENFVLKLFHFAFDYGFEYVGIQNNFYTLTQTDRMLLSVLNMMHIHKPFMIYANKTLPKKETLNIISKFFGKYIYYTTPSIEFNTSQFNDLIYSHMPNGNWLCITHSETIKNEMLSAIADRAMEVYRMIKASEEEGIYTEGMERFNINKKSFNVFFMFDIEGKVNKEMIPSVIREHYRLVGFSVVSIDAYIRIILNNFVFCNIESIVRKVKLAINLINAKYANNITKESYENMSFYYVKGLKRYLRDRIEQIEKKNECVFVMKGLEEIMKPFIQDKEGLHRLLLLIFDVKRESEPVVVVNEKDKKDANKETEMTIKDEDEFAYIDEYLNQETSLFHFNDKSYQNKIKQMYIALSSTNDFSQPSHIVLVGPTLSGKTNTLITLHSITKKLNNQNEEKYPLFAYIKIFPNSLDSHSLFALNDIKTAHQNNNVFFANMLSYFSEVSERELADIDLHYERLRRSQRVANVSPPESPRKIAERFKERKSQIVPIPVEKNEIKEDENESEGSKNEDNVKEEANDQSENEPKKAKTINAIVFDGDINREWVQYLTFLNDQNSEMVYANGIREIMKGSKFIYETSTLTFASPSMITREIIFSFSYEEFKWENIAYSYIETDPKLNANNDLKCYIRGLFENYIPQILDFIEVNKIECVSRHNAINQNFIIRNLIKFYDAMLPQFDFNDNKIGRKNQNSTPKIEIIKRQALSIFIFCTAWTINFTTNFLIKTKIEKLISDVFKTDDLKGPIFDYVINETKCEFDLWTNMMNANEYIDQHFITTQDNFPYQYIISKLICEAVPCLIISKRGVGKTLMLNSILNRLESRSHIKSLRIQMTYRTLNSQMQNFICSHLDMIKKRIYGDKYNREIAIFIDDVNLASQRDICVQSHEYIRSVLQTMTVYDNKANEMKFFDKMNFILCGNYHSTISHQSFPRFISQFNLVTITSQDDVYSAIFKPRLEAHFREFIPNTSNITANQYLFALFKTMELLRKSIVYNYANLHYNFTLRDIANVINAFINFKYKGGSDYPEYLKKVFFYETYLMYTNKISRDEDVNVFKENLCNAYSSFFKQDKVKSGDVFANFDNEEMYAFAANYFEEKNDEHIFIDKKKKICDFVKTKINEFYNNARNKNEYYKIYDFNDNMVDYIIRILRVLENEQTNLILLGPAYAGKEMLLKIALYIRKVEICEVNNFLFFKSKSDLANKCLCAMLKCAVYQNKKIMIIFANELFDNDDNTEYIYETIRILLNGELAIETFSSFLDDNNNLPHSTIKTRIESNVAFAISISECTSPYEKLFINYPFIANKASTICIKEYSEANLTCISSNIIAKFISERDTVIEISELMLKMHSFAKTLYEYFSKKISHLIPHSQIHYIKMCDYFANNYTKFKSQLMSKYETFKYARDIIPKCESAISLLQSEIDKLTPLKENSESLIEESRHKISDLLVEKNMIKAKRGDEERPMNYIDNERNTKETALNEILGPSRELLRKSGLPVHKITEKDIVEIKNTYDNSPNGRYLLSKVYECLNDSNTEWDYIKKTIDAKLMRTFANIDISKAPHKIAVIAKEIASNSEYANGDKYQKPYRICGILCDYFNAMNNYFHEYAKQKDAIANIEEMKAKVETHKKAIAALMESFKVIEGKISELEKNISMIDINKTNYLSQIVKHECLKKEIEIFCELTKEKNDLWAKKCEHLENIIKHYDYYFAFISSYVTYAPILNRSYRTKFTNYFYANIASKEITARTFVELMFALLNETDIVDRDILSAVDSCDDFTKENLILIHKIFNHKTAFILDHSQSAIKTISQFIEYKEMKSISEITFSNNYNEIKEKIEKALRIGSSLFIRNCNAEMYRYMRSVVKSEFANEKQKRIVYIGDDKCEVNESFRLYLMRSSRDMRMNEEVFYYANVINFDLPKEEVRGKLFHLISQENSKDDYVAYRKTKNEVTKEKFKLCDLIAKMNKSIASFDLSGNVEKISNVQSANEKYKNEISLYNASLANIEALKEKVGDMRNELHSHFGLIAENAVEAYRWINRFFAFKPTYAISLENVALIINSFINEKNETMNANRTAKREAKRRKIMNNDSVSDEDEKSELSESEKEVNVNDDSDVFIYKKSDLKQFYAHIYNSISSLYQSADRRIFLLCLSFAFLRLRDEIPKDYSRWICEVYEISSNNNSTSLTKSPIKTLSDEIWTKIKTINERCSFCFSLIIEDIEANAANWTEYFSEDANVISNATCHYLTNKFRLPNEDLDFAFNSYKKFLFFYIAKPQHCTLLINETIHSIFADDIKMQNEDIQRTFTHIASDKFIAVYNIRDMNFYDKTLTQYCYNELSEMIPDAKYKEINAKSELTLNELELIQSAMKSGGVIVIKNANVLTESYANVIKSIKETSLDENGNISKNKIHSGFRLVLLFEDNSMINANVFPFCYFVENVSCDDYNAKYFLNQIANKINKNTFDSLLNVTPNIVRKIARKLFFTYAIVYATIRSFRNYFLPFTFEIKDFFNILTYIENFFANFNEDKANAFVNVENTFEFNFVNFTNLINNVFLISRLINKNDILILQRILGGFFEAKMLLNDNFYFCAKKIQIPIEMLPLENDITFANLVEIINLYSESDFESIIPSILNYSRSEEKNNSQIAKFDCVMRTMRNAIQGPEIENELNENKSIDAQKVIKKLIAIKESIPHLIKYIIDENENNPDEEIAINPQLFKTNKMDLYANPLDESLLYEIKYYNDYIMRINQHCADLISMLKGEKEYTNEERYKHALYDISSNQSPHFLLDDKIFKKRRYTLTAWESKLRLNIENLRQWVKDGALRIYHLPMFTNAKLFINCVKMHFCRKYINDIINNANSPSISPDMIKLKFAFTKYKSFNDIKEKELKSIQLLNQNEILFLDGFVVNNANIDNEKMTMQFTSQQMRIKCNVAYVTYTIEKYAINEDNNIITQNIKNENYNDEYDDDDESEDESGYEENKPANKRSNNKMTVHGNEEKTNDKVLSIPIIDTYDDDEEENIYSLNEPFGEFEFKLRNSEDTVNVIEKKVKIFIDDIDDYIK